MKTFMIVVLTLSLLAAAIATRPQKRDLALYLLDQQSADVQPGDLDKARDAAGAVVLKDWILWTEVQRDGKTVYTGLFAHWISHEKPLDKKLPPVSELAKLINK